MSDLDLNFLNHTIGEQLAISFISETKMDLGNALIYVMFDCVTSPKDGQHFHQGEPYLKGGQ